MVSTSLSLYLRDQVTPATACGLMPLALATWYFLARSDVQSRPTMAGSTAWTIPNSLPARSPTSV